MYSYLGVRRKNLYYDLVQEIWSDIDTQSQNICQILIPNPEFKRRLPPRFEFSRAGTRILVLGGH